MKFKPSLQNLETRDTPSSPDPSAPIGNTPEPPPIITPGPSTPIGSSGDPHGR